MRSAFGFLLWGALLASSSAAEYRLFPFANDKPIHAEGERSSYFFELPRGLSVTKDASFTLDYEAAPGLPAAQSRLTVVFNGQPVDTRDVKGAAQWVVRLPLRYFKPGFNDVTVTAQSQGGERPCRENDDWGNWIRFRRSSVIALDLALPNASSLRSYPFPYVDWLAAPAKAMPIAFTPSPGSESLSAALNLAAGWGRRMSDRPLLVRLTSTAPVGPAVRLALQTEPGQPRPAIEARSDGLWITGRSAKGLNAAIRTLSDPLAVAQMRGASSAALEEASLPDEMSTRVGTVSLGDLGYPSVSLSGAGTQRTTLVLRRPLAARLGRGGSLRLQFRHAATLRQARSLLSVTMNDQPIGSVALTTDNANGGELVCPIPVEQADRNEWVVQISAHNDLGNVDCSKRYDDIAWTTILGTSDIELREGSLPSTAYLEGFPYFRDGKGKLPDALAMGFGPNPGPGALTLAATIAARSAQSNRAVPNWTAAVGSPVTEQDVAVGLYSEPERFQPLASNLLVAPSKEGLPTVAKELRILPSTLQGAVVVQAVEKPSGGAAYVVLGASEDALGRFAAFLASPQSAGVLKGQVAVFTKEGEIFTFDTTSSSERRAAEAAEMRRYKPSMQLIMGVVLALLAILGVFIGSKFVKRKRASS